MLEKARQCLLSEQPCYPKSLMLHWILQELKEDARKPCGWGQHWMPFDSSFEWKKRYRRWKIAGDDTSSKSHIRPLMVLCGWWFWNQFDSINDYIIVQVSRILTGSRPWSISGQTHDWRNQFEVFSSVFLKAFRLKGLLWLQKLTWPDSILLSLWMFHFTYEKPVKSSLTVARF